MTEQEAFNDPEMKVILLLSGYARQLKEGKDFENTTYKTAESIVKLFSIPVVGVRSEQLCQHDNKVTNRICDDCGQTITYVPN